MQTTRRISEPWIERFYSFTEGLPSPALFRKWGAISAVAGALERKIWIRTAYGVLYPNLYTLLVAPPGVGKTVITERIWHLWENLEDHFVAIPSVTHATLADELHDAERRIIRPNDTPSVVTFNSLLISINEFGIFLPAYENEMMNKLTDLYDCHQYGERRRNKDLNFKIPHPQLNMIAATQPAYLRNILPEGAWDQGFLSRVLIIYSGESAITDVFSTEAENVTSDSEWADLKHDLQHIGNLFGKLEFTKDAADSISLWHKDRGPPRPTHPKLTHYCSRRTAHLLKLAQVASISESDDLVIELHHVQTALNWMVEAEAIMPDIFKAMNVGGDSKVIEETWHYLYELWLKDKKPVPQFRAVEFIKSRTPAHNVMRIVEVMEKANIIEQCMEPKVGTCYKIRPMREAI